MSVIYTQEEKDWLEKHCDVCKRTLVVCNADSCERWG